MVQGPLVSTDRGTLPAGTVKGPVTISCDGTKSTVTDPISNPIQPHSVCAGAHSISLGTVPACLSSAEEYVPPRKNKVRRITEMRMTAMRVP